jgi:transposase
MNCSRTRGKKGDENFDPLDPPRCRANTQRGRGTYANDRPPVLGVIGGETGAIRLRVVLDTKSRTLCSFVQQFTHPDTVVYTNEYQSYNALQRIRETVCHGVKEWARAIRMDGMKSIPIPTKGCGRDCAISCVPFTGYASVFFMVTLRFMSFVSISRPFRPFHFGPCSLSLSLNMSQEFYGTQNR